MAANTLNDRLTAAGKKLVAVVAVVVGVIHLLNVTGTLVMSTLTLRVIHLMAMLVIVLLGGKKAAPTLAAGLTRAALALCAVVCSVYLLFRWESISTSGGVTNSTDVIMGVILVLVVIEATRRTLGARWRLLSRCFWHIRLSRPICLVYSRDVITVYRAFSDSCSQRRRGFTARRSACRPHTLSCSASTVRFSANSGPARSCFGFQPPLHRNLWRPQPRRQLFLICSSA